MKNKSNVDKLFSFKKEKEVLIPLYDSAVSAGFTSPAEDYIEDYIDLNQYIIKNPHSTFFVRVRGDSMKGAGIHSGDILVVDKSLISSLENLKNKIVLAVIDGEFLVKTLIKKQQKFYLAPENKDYEKILITEDMDFQVWGVVSGLIRLYGK